MRLKFLLAAFAFPASTHLPAVGVACVGSLFFVMLLQVAADQSPTLLSIIWESSAGQRIGAKLSTANEMMLLEISTRDCYPCMTSNTWDPEA